MKLEERFMLANIEDDARRIKFCQVFIGQTREGILSQLSDEMTWEEPKRELIEWLGDGKVKKRSLDSTETARKG